MWRVKSKWESALSVDEQVTDPLTNQPAVITHTLPPGGQVYLKTPGVLTSHMRSRGKVECIEVSETEYQEFQERQQKEAQIRAIRLMKAKVAMGKLGVDVLPEQYRPVANVGSTKIESSSEAVPSMRRRFRNQDQV